MIKIEVVPNPSPLKVLNEALERSGFLRQQHVISRTKSRKTTRMARPPPTEAMMMMVSMVKGGGVGVGIGVGVLLVVLQLDVGVSWHCV